jgi:hypothetical protein
MGKPPDRPEIAGFKLLTIPAVMDFLVKTDNKGIRRYGTFSIASIPYLTALSHSPSLVTIVNILNF